jgi:hypothetical protein
VYFTSTQLSLCERFPLLCLLSFFTETLSGRFHHKFTSSLDSDFSLKKDFFYTLSEETPRQCLKKLLPIPAQFPKIKLLVCRSIKKAAGNAGPGIHGSRGGAPALRAQTLPAAD